MKASNRLALTVSTLVFAAFAATAAAADITIDASAVEPLPGRDYSMRLDLAAARFEQIDAQSGEIRVRGFSAECVANLAPGLWLAVLAAPDRLELLPMGVTADRATAVAAGCRTAAAQPATLPPLLLQEIAARGGGVILVDNATFGAADGGRVASQAAQ